LQKAGGYYDTYDKKAGSVLQFKIDSFSVKFTDGNETYAVRGWKGNYWTAAGGEIGIYSGEGPGITVGISEPGSGAGKTTIDIQFTLKAKDGSFSFTAPKQNTYWLFAAKPLMNGFFEDKKGAYTMKGSVDFGENTSLANAFQAEVQKNHPELKDFERDGNAFSFTWE